MTRWGRRGDDAPPSGIGDVLGAARRGMGVPLRRAAEETHLRESYLAALERDDVDGLGLDPAYVRGTLRTYADYLGLDSDSLVARHRALEGSAGAPTGSAGAPAGSAGAPTASTVPTGGRRVPDGVLRALVGVAGLIVIAVGAFAAGELLARRLARPPTTAGTAGPDRSGDDAEVLSRSGGTPASDAATAPLTLRLEFAEPTRMRVVADGRTALDGRAASSSVEEFEADRRLTVRVSEPRAVTLTLNGVRYDATARDRDGPVKFVCDADDGCRVVE